MEAFHDKDKNYDNIINCIMKSSSYKEGLLLTIKQNLTNNIFFYIIYVLVRFFPLMILTGNYHETFPRRENKEFNSISDSKWLRNITLLKLTKILKLNSDIYAYICLVIFVLFIIRIMLYLFTLNKFKDKEISDEWPKLYKYNIIMDHIAILFFPYFIEFLSFIYFIIFIPNTFILIPKDNNKELLIIILITNTLLIIGYNAINYFYFIYLNKKYTIEWYEAYESLNNEKFVIINKPIKYKYPKIVLYIIFFLQNFILFQNIELYIKNRFLFKIIITCILFLIFTVLFFASIHKYNYSTFINNLVDILLFYCFYSIIVDFLIYYFDSIVFDISKEIIFILVKLLISFLSYISLKLIYRKHFKKLINEVLFEEKNKKKNEDKLINCLLYLNELMIKIKEEKDVQSAYLLIVFFYEHIKNCHKIFCNCKILQLFLQKELNEYKVKQGDKNSILDDSKGQIYDILVILNYLYESIFIEYDYYNKYSLSILLAEHYCHLRNNPVMSFSLVHTLLLKRKDKLRIEELVTLHELCQKYVFYILAQAKDKLTKEIQNRNEGIKENDILLINLKDEYFKKYYNVLDIAYRAKKIIHNYIDNEIRILKYKNMFEETIEFKLDDNNDEIEKVNIKFFKEESNMQKDFSEKEMKKIKKLNTNIFSCNTKNNLFYIISLLKIEQYDYNRLINTINKIEIFKGLPIILIFKYYLFFDIFEGGKLPANISNKLNNSISNYNGLYSSNITSTTYSLLTQKFKKQNYMNNSKYYNIFQYKKELRIKYFSETLALVLGYKQKDITNEKVDVLMPKEFSKSHQNMIKRLLINEQLKYANPEKAKIFDSTGTKIYLIKVQGIMIYELSKNLTYITENNFITDNDYIFMLNNNFELLAHNKNFENDYSLNYSIFRDFNLKILDIFKIRPNKIYERFAKEFKNIHYQKYIRQARVEEYFTPQLFVPQGEKSIGMMNQNSFNSVKNNILSKIVGSNKENNLIESSNKDEEEINKLITSEKSQNLINDFFFNMGQFIFHGTFYITLNKKKFIDNLSKELSKIPNTDLMFEGDKNNYNLIVTSKNILQKILSKNDLSNNFIEIQITFSYYYDKPFYFISVYDKNKQSFKINKSNFKLNNNYMSLLTSTANTNFPKHRSIINNIIMEPKNKLISKKMMNQSTIGVSHQLNLRNNNKNLLDNNLNNNSFSNLNKLNTNYYDHCESFGSDKIIERMEKYRNEINSETTIRVIKYVLSIICIIVLVIYIIILDYQNHNIELIHKTFQCYYYNFYSKNSILHFQTVIIERYYDLSSLSNNNFTTEEDYLFVIKVITPLLKEGFHYFTSLFYEYNLEIGSDFNLLFTKRDYRKLGGFWEEIVYTSEYPIEMDTLIYNIYSALDLNENQNEIMTDVDNYLFRKAIENNDNKTRVYSNFIKLVYYFDINYELTWSHVFDNIERSIMKSYRDYVNVKLKTYYAFEVIGLSFIIIFFVISLIYLYYANTVIMKNIIFIFLDFSDNDTQMIKNGYTKIMMMKLYEFKNCIIDFSLDKVNNYTKNLDNIEENKINSMSRNKTILSLIEKTETKVNKNKQTLKINNEKRNNSSIRKVDLGSKKKENAKDMKYLTKDESSNQTNSSLHQLNRSNSFLKDKLNNINNLNLSPLQNSANQNNIESTNNPNTNNLANNKSDMNRLSNRGYRKIKKQNNSISINNYGMNVDDSKDPIQEVIINKSNKEYISLIKVYSFIVLILLILITVYSIFKLVNTINYHNIYEDIFYVLKVVTNRYSILNYYYNTLKETIVFPTEIQMESLDNSSFVFQEYNEQYKQILNKDINNFVKLKELLNLMQDSELNSNETMINDFCVGYDLCLKYLYSPYNIMVAGIDFIFQSTFIDINKMYLDYKSISDKKDKQKIRELINNNKFLTIGFFIEYAFIYIKTVVFNAFVSDEEAFKAKFTNNMRYLNLITVIFAIFSFLFVVVFIFVTISIYAEPIKKASFRISRSFYYIKKYNFLMGGEKTITQ